MVFVLCTCGRHEHDRQVSIQVFLFLFLLLVSYRYAQAASSVRIECSGVSTKIGFGLADLVDEDVVLRQVSMHQVALLVELAHEQHQLRIE